MDTDECAEQKAASFVQPADHQNHQNEDEACAPFCNCTCCGHVVNSNSLEIKIAVVKPFFKEELQSYYNNISLPSDFFGNIWQPPRVG